MFDHFGFSEEQAEKLVSQKVTIKHCFKFAKDFAVGNSEEPFTKVNLYLYIDEHGDPDEGAPFKHKLIARQMFENLSVMDKIEISEYIADLEDGEF